MRWSCSDNKHIWWLTYAKESEKRRQSASEKLESNLRKHYSNTVSTSRTPPKRDHHGYTHG